MDDQASGQRVTRRTVLAASIPAGLLLAAKPGTAYASTGRPAMASGTASAAHDVVRRLLGHTRADQIDLRLAGSRPEGFRVARASGRVLVDASTGSALLAGVNAYLQRVAGVDVSWTGDSLNRLPDRLPLPRQEITEQASVTHRFVFNDTDDAYTGAYRDWADWERLIDVLALHGINRVFVPIGTEAVYLATFSGLGYTAKELLDWIPQPDHQPWWLLQNMAGFPDPVTARLVADRARLGRQIVERLASLGIEPVLPGYFGTVPPDFATKVADARTVPQGDWVGFTRPDWLDPTCPAYPRVAEAFYAASAELLGRAAYYKMDLLHEGGTPGPVQVGPASKAVQDALEKARPGATWVFLGWQKNPRPDTLAGIDRTKVLIVDGLSDRYAGWDRNQTWPDTTYAFGSIWNFGGHTTIGANAGVWEDRFWSWRAETGSTLDGIALMPEGSANNPAAFDHLTGLAWRSGPVTSADWFADWSRRRHGGSDAHAASAWRTIGTTAYALPADGWSEAQDGLFAAQPSLDATSAAAWSPGSMRYDADTFAQALPALLAVPPGLRRSTAYRYDLVDVARQVLANRARTLLPQLKSAYDAKDRATFDRLAATWADHMSWLDKITGTIPETMLGPWLAQARAAGHDTAESDALETGARTLLTVWARREGFDQGLGDYANREWSGLIGSYYAPRWTAYLDELSAALAEGREPRSFDWYQRGADWAAARAPVPTTPSGDTYDVATEVLAFLQRTS